MKFTITQVLILVLIVIIFITTPISNEVLYWAIIPIILVLVILFILVTLIKKLSKIQLKRPMIQVIFERAKPNIKKDKLKVKSELSTLETLKKSNLLPKDYYEKAKESLKQKLKKLNKESRNTI